MKPGYRGDMNVLKFTVIYMLNSIDEPAAWSLIKGCFYTKILVVCSMDFDRQESCFHIVSTLHCYCTVKALLTVDFELIYTHKTIAI